MKQYPLCAKHGLRPIWYGGHHVISHHQMDILRKKKSAKWVGRFNAFFGVRTICEAGLFADDVEGVLQRMEASGQRATQQSIGFPL